MNIDYRSRHALSARIWRSEHIRGYVLLLSRHLTLAEMAGWRDTAADIVAILHDCEPLEAVREHEYAGWVLWIAYTYYAVRDVVTARCAVERAMQEWPGDERLLRMRDVIGTQKEAG